MTTQGWVGIDGEGIGRYPHQYVMICDSRGDYLEDVNGLGSAPIFDWLLSRPEGKLCGYYLGYDYTMWLKDLPNKSIYRLMRPELRVSGGGYSRIYWKGYRLHYLQRSLQIQRGDRSVIIWDIGPYYQCSFVAAMRKSGIGIEELDHIQRMKDRRGSWESHSLDEIRDYCLSECRLLEQLAERLESSHHAIGVRPPSWYGPGSTAGAVLKSHKIHEKRGDVPIAVESAANAAYFGGRFENSTIGEKINVWGYDLVSAYPAQTLKLPCLEHGRWYRTQKPPLFSKGRSLVLAEVTDVGPTRWAPLPCRVGKGHILYPRGGFKVWVWDEEFRWARTWPGVRALDCWTYYTDCECKPFGFIAEMFQARKEAADLEKGAYKLALNSLYGKLAQRVGNPRYASVIWAGMVTSGTRAKILAMMGRHTSLDNIYAVATDGIYSCEEMQVPPEPGLGQWSGKYHGDMVFVRPGIYWARLAAGGVEDQALRARGFGAKKIGSVMQEIQAAIEAGESSISLGLATGFGGAKETVYRTGKGVIKRSKAYAQWHELPANLSLRPAPKRDEHWMPPMLDGVESIPYDQSRDKSAQLLAMADRMAECLRG